MEHTENKHAGGGGEQQNEQTKHKNQTQTPKHTYDTKLNKWKTQNKNKHEQTIHTQTRNT